MKKEAKKKVGKKAGWSILAALTTIVLAIVVLSVSTKVQQPFTTEDGYIADS